MLKPITCPRCGKLVCRAKIESEIQLVCHHCKLEFKGIVDKNGGVHALPIEERLSVKKIN